LAFHFLPNRKKEEEESTHANIKERKVVDKHIHTYIKIIKQLLTGSKGFLFLPR
jgi:hypothetical protein